MELLPSSPEARLSTNRAIVNAKCLGFVRNLHLYRYPEKYAQFWRYCHATSVLLGEVRGSWTDFLTDRMELDPQYSFKQKAAWMVDDLNYVFKFLGKEDGIQHPLSLRDYVLGQAGGNTETQPEYRDEKGSLLASEDLLPSEQEWGSMVTGKTRVRLNEDKFYDWLAPRINPKWPELPPKPESSITLPGFEEFRPFELMGGIVVSQSLEELCLPAPPLET